MTTGTYLGGYPSDKFAFPRSYAYLLTTVGDSNDVEVDGDTITMFISRPLNYGIVYVLNDFIWPWSSNRYTLDFVVYDCWWFFGTDGVHHPQAFTVNYWQRAPLGINSISIIQPLAGTFEALIPLPHQPPGYWTPAPIPPYN